MARTGLGAASCGAAKRGCAASRDSRVMLDWTEGAAVTDPKLVYPPVPRERALLYGLTGAEASAYSSRGANVKHSREQREAIQEPRSPPRNTDTKGTGRTIADSVVTRTYPKERPREGDIMEDPALTSTTPVRVQPIERPRIAIMIAWTAAYSNRIVTMTMMFPCDKLEATNAISAAPTTSTNSAATRFPGDAGTGTRPGEEDVIAPSAKLNRRDPSRRSRPAGVGSGKVPE